jgi:hypothetical protein
MLMYLKNLLEIILIKNYCFFFSVFLLNFEFLLMFGLEFFSRAGGMI